jgi:hypothetical protein
MEWHLTGKGDERPAIQFAAGTFKSFAVGAVGMSKNQELQGHDSKQRRMFLWRHRN